MINLLQCGGIGPKSVRKRIVPSFMLVQLLGTISSSSTSTMAANLKQQTANLHFRSLPKVGSISHACVPISLPYRVPA